MDPLVTPKWLSQHLSNRDLRIFDVRGSVKKVDVGPGVVAAEYLSNRADFIARHIPGAFFVDWVNDLTDWQNDKWGYVARKDQIQKTLAEAEVSNDSIVIAYDGTGDQYSSRLWWTLRYYGFSKVAVLDGGFDGWLSENGETESGEPIYRRSAGGGKSTTLTEQEGWRMTCSEVRDALGKIQIIDARDEGQFTASYRRAARGGRIPGAINVSKTLLFGKKGGYRDLGELRELFSSRGIDLERPVVAYCNGGMASTTVVLALRMIGAQAASYDGSWNEWGNREELPVELP